MSHADTVNNWFRERLSGGPIAQHTPAYNQLVEALPDLITRLEVKLAAAADDANPVRAAPAKAAKAPPAGAPAAPLAGAKPDAAA